MSAYPPPPPSTPPPPPGGQYPPPYDAYAMRAQARAVRVQERAQRQAAKAQRRAATAQARYQRRSLRRRSVVGPLLILTLGIMFLLAQVGRISWSWSLDWFGRWWPAVLVVAGLILLLEWALDQRRETLGSRSLGGGVVFLLVLLVLAGLSSRAIESGTDWKNHAFGPGFLGWDQMFGEQHDAYDDVTSAIATGSALTIRDPHGDVTVTGSSSDGQVHVNVHKHAYAWKDSDVQNMEGALQPTFSNEGKDLVLTVATVRGGEADLTITVPAATAVTVNDDHGDVNVSQLHAALTLSANRGDVDINGVTGDVQASVNDDNATLTLQNITGAVSIEGHSGDIEISDVTGAVHLQGEFFGDTHLEHVGGQVRFETNRTLFTAGRLDDEFSVEKDSLDADELLGPVVLKTSDKNITLDRVQGDVDVTDSNGSVAVTHAPPLGVVEIQNRHGSVDVGLPGSAGFVLNAQTRNGDMENDFGLSTQDQNENHSLRGTVAGGGPTVTIETSDGDVTVRKSSVAPLPPVPPAVPSAPAAPGFTAAPPKAPKGPHTPTAPPAPPAVPATTNF